MPFPVRPAWLLSSGGHGLLNLPLNDPPWWRTRWGSGSKGVCLNKLGGASSRQDLVFPPLFLAGRGAWEDGWGKTWPDTSGKSALRVGVVSDGCIDELLRREPDRASASCLGPRFCQRKNGELWRNRWISGALPPGPTIIGLVDEAEGSQGDGHVGCHLRLVGLSLVGFSQQDAAQCCSFKQIPFLPMKTIPEGGTIHAAPKLSLYFQPLIFASQGLQFQRRNNSISVCLRWKVSITSMVFKHQLCTHISIEFCGQQKSWRCHYACKTIKSGIVIQVQFSFLISTCTRFYRPDDYLAEDAVFLPFGLCHQRWTTTSLSLILRFSGEDPSRLSSVMVPQNLQLNPQPLVHTLDRPSGEPPAGHQPVWSAMEALKDCKCSNIESVLSTDERSLFGFISNLWYRLQAFRSSFFYSVRLGTFNPLFSALLLKRVVL